jgi:plasmid maintenance system antidote protein VapI/Zn-dependent peptidase ImmA (M78 family)
MDSSSEFVPQWVSTPGETIVDALNDRGWTRADLAARLGEAEEVVEDLIIGDRSITVGIAKQLTNVLGASVAFWMARDLQYRKDFKRLQRVEDQWIRSLPVREMRQMGWLSDRCQTEAEALFRFFDVSSVSAWRRRYSPILTSVEFKNSPSFESSPAAVVAWIRQGQRVGSMTSCKPWNPDALPSALSALKKLTKIGRPERFLPRLVQAMAECGVVVALVPAPAGCRASGASLWISTQKALLLLSSRHLTDDHFWFTFYHECGHLLLHRSEQAFVDSEDMLAGEGQASTPGSETQEDEANAFALDSLVTAEVLRSLRRIRPTHKEVLRLAAQAGISPGILVGQLQRMGRVGPERLNRLKRRYKWVHGQLVSHERK